MVMIQLDFESILNNLEPSYKNIDFRAALFKENSIWNYILSIFRFTNNSSVEILKKHHEQNLDKYHTENFKIIHKILKIEEWKKE